MSSNRVSLRLVQLEPDASSCTASSSLAAAFPVGAARATSGVCAPDGVGLLVEEGEDASDRGRLARAGAAADDRDAAQHARCGREALEVGLVALEEPCQPVGEEGLVDVVGRLAAGDEVVGDGPLVLPVAVEVERGADESQRPFLTAALADGNERAGGQGCDPVLGLRPRQRLQVDRGLEVARRGGCDRGQVDADRSSRGARTASAVPSNVLSSTSPQSRARRRATCTSAAARTPASLKARSVPAAPRAYMGVMDDRRSRGHSRRGPPAVEQVLSPSTSRGAGGRRGNPRMDGRRRGGRWPSRAKSAQERPTTPGEPRARVVVGEPCRAHSDAAQRGRAGPAAECAAPHRLRQCRRPVMPGS